MSDLGPIETFPRKGSESFHNDGCQLGFNLLNFWQWSSSDLVSNSLRGVLAEYLVAQAIGVTNGTVREEWAAYDLETLDGTRVEVKSAAYIQSWHQDSLSKITFSVRKTRAWDKQTNKQCMIIRRQADVYVFALLKHTQQSTIDPLNVAQWEFFVVPTIMLDNRKRSQHSITLPSLQSLIGESVRYSELKHAIEESGRIQKDLRIEEN
jgi:hypothetical protein